MIERIIEKAKKENKKVYIYAHKFPDGDAISSSQAIVQYLKRFNIESEYVVTKPIYSYTGIVGKIPTMQEVDANSISIIVDTSTLSYAENNLFKNSIPENIFIIDHHVKDTGNSCIEDELNIPPQNVIRDDSASSTCEILVSEFEKEKVDPKIANMLTLGLMTDTARLKFIKNNTLKNLQTLLEAGADYEYVMSICNRKSKLKEEVGLAKSFLSSKRIQIGNTFGIMLPINNKTIKNLSNEYSIRNIQKKIFKMSDITNCSFNCICAENRPNEFDLEFRSTPIYGNFNVQQLATMYGGGGHYYASGCHISEENEENRKNIALTIKQEVIDKYSEQAMESKEIDLTEEDKQLLEILERTNRLQKGVTPQILAQVDNLYKKGANYDYTFKTFKSYKRFMLENELISRIQSRDYKQKKPIVKIFISLQDIDMLTKKYNISEDEILDTISAFSDIDIESASIILQNGKKSSIDKDGNIEYQKPNNSIDISQNR